MQHQCIKHSFKNLGINYKSENQLLFSSSQDSEDFDDFDDEEEEEESYSGESSSLELREEAPLRFSTRRGRPCRSLTLPGPGASTERPALRRSTRSLSYTHNQAVKHTHTKVKQHVQSTHEHKVSFVTLIYSRKIINRCIDIRKIWLS